MKLLAWLYLRSPLWAVRLIVPARINYADNGKFNEAVEAEYMRSTIVWYRKHHLTDK